MGVQKDKGMDETEKERMYACWFYSAPGIGGRTMEKLSAICPGWEEIYRAGEKLWKRVLTDRQLEQMRIFAKSVEPETLQESLRKKKIRFATLRDTAYPARLRNIPDPPYGLFFKGGVSLRRIACPWRSSVPEIAPNTGALLQAASAEGWGNAVCRSSAVWPEELTESVRKPH